MVEPMDIDENGLSGEATRAESVEERSVKRSDTPDSTEVIAIPTLANRRLVRSMYAPDVTACILMLDDCAGKRSPETGVGKFGAEGRLS
jgi:hypothetical protein